MGPGDAVGVLRGLFALLFGLYAAAGIRDVHRYGVRRRFDLLPGMDPHRHVTDEAGLAALLASTRGGTAAVSLALGVIILWTDIAIWLPAIAFPVIVIVSWLVLVAGSRRYIADEDPGP